MADSNDGAMSDQLPTVAAAAARMGISTAAVRRLVQAGKIRHVRPTLGGRKVLIRAADVEAHLERSTIAGDANDRPMLTHVVPQHLRRGGPPSGPAGRRSGSRRS